MSRLAFPFRIAATGRSAVVEERSDLHVRQMLELLIMTAIGERPMRPDFGSPVRQMVFTAGDGAAGLALQATLHATISQWLGHLVEVDGLAVNFDNGNGRLEIEVTYLVRATLKGDRLRVQATAS